MGHGLVIAIDGPAGSGKSSVSRAVATRLDLQYLDTGAMYRAMTWAVLQAGIDPEDTSAVVSAVTGETPPDLRSGTDPTNPTIHVGDIDVADPIRGSVVTESVSAVSAVPQVRTHLVDLQQRYVADSVADGGAGIVVEGRDIGSVVLPDADVKIFLTADPSVRAQRRAAENPAGSNPSLTATESALLARDAKDSSRAVSPLTKADGAIEVDTTNLAFDEVVEVVVELCRQASKQ